MPPRIVEAIRIGGINSTTSSTSGNIIPNKGNDIARFQANDNFEKRMGKPDKTVEKQSFEFNINEETNKIQKNTYVVSEPDVNAVPIKNS